MSESLPKLLTYVEAAKILGIAPQTLRAWVSARKIPCVKLGGAVRFTPKMVQRPHWILYQGGYQMINEIMKWIDRESKNLHLWGIGYNDQIPWWKGVGRRKD